MARKRFGIEFKGFQELFEELGKVGGDINHIAEECLEIVPDIINPKLEADIKKHHRSGQTEKSLAKNQHVEWSGTMAKMPVGFKISDGGLASIFLMYGTARHAPANQYGKASGVNNGMQADKKLFDDIYGANVKKQINSKQKEIVVKEITKRMGG